MKRIGPTMKRIASIVRRMPGNTAHALRLEVYPQIVMGYLYGAFRRAESAGLIRSESRGKRKVYFPC